jgi:WD40 repeat protein
MMTINDRISEEKRDYLFRHLIAHLVEVGDLEKIQHVLTMYNYLQLKTEYLGIKVLINDYESTIDSFNIQKPHVADGLISIRDALILSQDIVRSDGKSLASQLIGRLPKKPQDPYKPEGEQFWRHLDWKEAITYMEDDDYPVFVEVVGPNKTINVDVKKLLLEAEEYDDTVWLRPDAATLANSFIDSPLVRTLSHQLGVKSVKLTPNNDLLITSSMNEIKIWDFYSGDIIRTIKEFGESVTVFSDGKRAASLADRQFIVIWEIDTGKEVLRIAHGHKDHVSGLAVSKDMDYVVSCSWDGTIKVWGASNGALFHHILAHSEWVVAVVMCPDGKSFISASLDGSIKIWDMQTGLMTRLVTTNADEVWGIDVSSDFEFLVSVSEDREIKIWDARTGSRIAALKEPGKTFNSIVWRDHLYSVALSPDNQFAVSGGGGYGEKAYNNVTIWDIKSQKRIASFQGHSQKVNAIDITSDGRYAISGSDDGHVRIWNMHNMQQGESKNSIQKRTPRTVSHAVVSATGKCCFSYSTDMVLRGWMINGNYQEAVFYKRDVVVDNIAISPDGKYGIADCYQYMLVCSLEDGRFYTLAKKTKKIESFGITPGNNEIFIVGDQKIKFLNLRNGEELSSIEINNGVELVAIDINSRGRNAVVDTYPPQRISLRSFINKITSFMSKVTNDSYYIPLNFSKSSFAISNDGKYSAVIRDRNNVFCWDMDKKIQIQSFQSSSAKIISLSITEDGKRIVLVTDKGVVEFWDVGTGRKICDFTSDFLPLNCDISLNGKIIATSTNLDHLHILYVENDD